MFGDSLFGESPFGWATDDEESPPAYLSDPDYIILSDPFAEYIYAAEIYPWALGNHS